MAYPRSNISRQFTDAEAALDERITSHLTAPPLQFDTSAGNELGYKWLSDDLALRSTLSQQLAGEQAMAYAQSERHEQARQFEEAAADEVEAIDFYKRANEKRSAGMPWQDAVGEGFSERPDQTMNGSLKRMLDNAQEFNKTDAEKQAKEASLKASLLTSKLAMLNAEDRLGFLESPDGEAYRAESLKAATEKELRGIPLSQQDDEIKLVDGKFKLEEAQLRYQNLQKLDPGLKGRAVLAAHAADNAVPIANTQGASDYIRANEEVGNMFLHPSFLAQQKPEDKVALGQALDKINSKSATEDERAAAQSVIDLATGRYMVQTAGAKDFKEKRETLMKFGEDTGKSLDALNKELTDIAGRVDKNKSPRKDNGAEAVNVAEAWMKKFVVTNPAAEGLYQSYEERINNARKQDSATAAQEARYAAFDFAKEAMVLMSGKSPTPPSDKKTTTEVRPGPYGASTTRNGKTYDWNGTHYVARP